MSRKVSWGQIVKEQELQSKEFKFIMETVTTEPWKFSEWTIKIGEQREWCAWTVATAHISPFLSNQIYVHLFLWLMSGNPLIFPHGNIFLVHLKKRKLKILWAFPRNGLSRGSEPWFLLNKTGLLWAGCALHTFSRYQWEKQIFHLPMIKP